MRKIVLLIVVMLLAVGTICAEDDAWMEINVNVKVSTSVFVESRKKTYPLEEAMEMAMYIANSSPDDVSFTIKLYKTDELFTAPAFSDDYLYGSGTMAVINLHYGIVSMEYSRFDDEVENDVGWDWYYFIALNDNRVLCISILE